MPASFKVCPCCFGLSPGNPAMALGQASRCPHCGEIAVMDIANETTTRPPVRREPPPSYNPGVNDERKTSRVWLWIGASVGAIGVVAIAGLLIFVAVSIAVFIYLLTVLARV